MISCVLTGGVGCGKSTVLEMLKAGLQEQLSAFSSDEEVHLILRQDAVIQELIRAFGPQVVDESGQVNRAWLRRVVFSDSAQKKKLEELLHPGVLAGLERARANALKDHEGKVFVAEVPLYYEIGGTVSSDLVIVAAASRPVQVRRLMARRGLDESTINQLLRAQWPIEAKVEKADVVIWNDGDQSALEAQVQVIIRKFSQG